MTELERVINEKFDYLRLRTALAQLSGLPTMAVVTDEHVRAIAKKLCDQEHEIKTLTAKISRVQDGLA